MKIPTWIHPEPQEVDVEVSVEDITRALSEAPDTPFAAFQMLNRAAQSMKATTDEIIAEMKPTQREVVANFLKDQAARFRDGEGKGNCKAPAADLDENDLDDEHPLWCVNEQIKDLLLGNGATEDHEKVLAFWRSTGLPEGTVRRIHAAIVCSERPENEQVEARRQ